jgi:hypothetical protein
MPTYTLSVLVTLPYLPLLFTLHALLSLLFLLYLACPTLPSPFLLPHALLFAYLPIASSLYICCLLFFSFFVPYLDLIYWCLPRPTFPSFSTMPSFPFFWVAMLIFPSFLFLPCCALPYPPFLKCHAFFLCPPFHLLPFYFCLPCPLPCPTLPCPIRSPLPYPPLSHPIPILPYLGLLFLTSMELLVKQYIQNFGRTIDQKNHTIIFFLYTCVKRKLNAPLTPCLRPPPFTPLEIIKRGSHKLLTNSHHLYLLISDVISLLISLFIPLSNNHSKWYSLIVFKP